MSDDDRDLEARLAAAEERVQNWKYFCLKHPEICPPAVAQEIADLRTHEATKAKLRWLESEIDRNGLRPLFSDTTSTKEERAAARRRINPTPRSPGDALAPANPETSDE